MITCYLDSQDYSTLTDPKTLSDEKIEVRQALKALAKQGHVKFLFSSTALSEIVALTPNAAKLAELRGELLSELCGNNALVSLDRLIEAEVSALIANKPPPTSMIDPNGNWFPDLGDIDSTDTPWQLVRQRAERDFGELGMSRQQRRAASRKIVKNGLPRGEFKAQLASQNSTAFATTLQQKYPMKPDHAEVLARYFLGRADKVEFTEALKASLRDPKWMMKWFTETHSMSSGIADIVRAPARDMAEGLHKLIKLLTDRALVLLQDGSEVNPTSKHGELSRYWEAMPARMLVRQVEEYATKRKLSIEIFSGSDVDHHCPGMSATVRALCSSVWENVTGARKELPSNSQPVDAMHAMYAPYVNVFRADRYMAPHIEKQVRKHGTVVVSRLTQLVDVLKREAKQAG